MSDGVLSQEEIDALLRSSAIGDATGGETQGQSKAVEESAAVSSTELGFVELSEIEKDAVGEVANIVMGSAATALSMILGKKVEITTPMVQLTDPDKFRQDYPLPYFLVNVEYISGLSGTNVLIIKNQDACVMVDLMMGGDGQAPPSEFDEMHLSAISEAMNQMMGSASTAISTIIKNRVEISPPLVESINFATDELKGSIGVKGQILVKVSFRMNIEGLVDTEIMQLIPLDLARMMVKSLMDEMSSFNPVKNVSIPVKPEMHEAFVIPESVITNPSPIAAAVEPSLASQTISFPQPEMSVFGNRGSVEPTLVKPVSIMRDIPVQPVQFAPLQPNYSPKEVANIDLIMDVPLQITVELGKSKKTIREILALGPGSVIELDKLAGEPVDLLVNGKLLAKGEVVVIDENFGIRVSDIISPVERVTSLQ